MFQQLYNWLFGAGSNDMCAFTIMRLYYQEQMWLANNKILKQMPAGFYSCYYFYYFFTIFFIVFVHCVKAVWLY